LQQTIRGRQIGAMPDRFTALDALIRDAESAAANHPDPLAVLAMLLKMVIASDADPYLLNGALIESIAATIVRRIPKERQEEVVAGEALRLLHARLRENGAI
jgi:hypothetical protein